MTGRTSARGTRASGVGPASDQASSGRAAPDRARRAGTDCASPSAIREIARRLDEKYGPPRSTDFLKQVATDPVDTLIKTVLSQATNDRNSEQAFARLKQAFPSWEQVAAAQEDQIVGLIRIGGLGPQKAGRIKALLHAIKEQAGSYNLDFLAGMTTSEAWDFLMGLEGVGPKTAACTLLFAFGRPVFPVDTHIHRIARRLGLALEKGTAEKVQRKMQDLVPPDLSEPLHVNLIRLGRDTCHARKPDCEGCPLRDLCRSEDAGPGSYAQTSSHPS
ncbi:MAG: endonuclease III [Bacillota bacterium]|nr:endonuclease III [Bacillota bacterium]